MKKEIFGPIHNKKYSEYIRDINVSGEYLLHLVNDILDLSKIVAGKMEPEYETFDIVQVILECQSVVCKLAENKNINLRITIPENLPLIYADRKALMQILMNLVSNAIKFTSSDGSVTIYAHVSGDNYIIKVIDTGCGISEGNIILITNPFTRAELSPLLAHEEGTGLGLSIVKSLVDLHSGKLEIKSNLGEGTTVTVTIPFQTASTELHTQDQSTLQLTKFV